MVLRFMKKHFWFGCVPAALHLVFVAFLYHAFVHDGNSSATYGWMLLLFIDYPVSLGMGIVQLQIKGNTIGTMALCQAFTSEYWAQSGGSFWDTP